MDVAFRAPFLEFDEVESVRVMDCGDGDRHCSKLHALEASAGADDEADFDDFDAQKLEMRLRRQARGLRAEVTRQEQLLRVLANKAATRRWLKQQRQFARLDD
jgi:hypothetical protein